MLKHIVLTRVLSDLTAKEKPLAVLDTHAGIGQYDFESPEAFKTGEWRDGICKILAADLPDQVKNLLAPYLELVGKLNPDGVLRHYPGSPAIAQSLLRPADRLILNELHPIDRATLAARFKNNRNIKVTGVDATQSAKAELPFSEKRGLMLVDPAFEVIDETDKVFSLLQNALKRMANTTMLIWYPLTTIKFADQFCTRMASSGVPGILRIELQVRPAADGAGLSGSGLLAINPPWTLYDEMQTILPALANILGIEKTGRGSLSWLTPRDN